MILYLLYFIIAITFSTDPKADIDSKVCSSFSQIIQKHLKGFRSGIKGILMRKIQILIKGNKNTTNQNDGNDEEDGHMISTMFMMMRR